MTRLFLLMVASDAIACAVYAIHCWRMRNGSDTARRILYMLCAIGVLSITLLASFVLRDLLPGRAWTAILAAAWLTRCVCVWAFVLHMLGVIDRRR